MAKANQDQVLISYKSITGKLSIDGFWQTFSGGVTSVETRKSYNGGSKFPDIIPSARPDTAPVTLGREYDSAIDDAIVAAARNAVGVERGTLSVQWLDADLQATGDAQVYSVLLRQLTPPEGDVNGRGAAAHYMLEFDVDTVS